MGDVGQGSSTTGDAGHGSSGIEGSIPSNVPHQDTTVSLFKRQCLSFFFLTPTHKA